MLAPERFVQWLSAHRHTDRRFGHVYRYHSRSDAHSIALCEMVVEDLLFVCPALREQASRHQVVYGINLNYTWTQSGKSKTLDLAIGPPANSATTARAASSELEKPAVTSQGAPLLSLMSQEKQLGEVWFACEAKSVMTEHGKSKPRVFDELSSSHEIIHQGNPKAIATGLTLVNIAQTFVSPLRQTGPDQLVVSTHQQPAAAEGMVKHLRGLRMRDAEGGVGFDAYATVVLECDNQTDPRLWTEPPSPRPGDIDHYQTFLDRVSQFYAEQFSIIPGAP